MAAALLAAAEVAVDGLETFVGLEAALVAGGHEAEREVVITLAELRVVGAARGVRGLQVEVGGGARRLAAAEVAGDDRGGEPAAEGGGREVLAEQAVAARAGLRVHRAVGDVAHERVAEVDGAAAAIDEAAGAEARDGLVAVEAHEVQEIRLREGAARDGEPAHDVALGGGQLAEAVADELLQRRRQAGVAAAVVADELVAAALALDDLQGAALEEGVDHLQEEERVARDLRDELAADVGDALAHAEARLDEAHLLLGREAAQLDLDEVREEGRDAVVRPGHEQEEHGRRVGAAEHLLEELEAGAVGPLEAVDDDDERLGARHRAEEEADAGDDEVAAVAGVVLGGVVVLAGAELGEARGELHRLRQARGRGAEELADDVRRLAARVLRAEARGGAEHVGGGRERQLALDGRALDREHAEGLGQVGEEGRDERALADAHLAGDDARDEVAAEGVLAGGAGGAAALDAHRLGRGQDGAADVVEGGEVERRALRGRRRAWLRGHRRRPTFDGFAWEERGRGRLAVRGEARGVGGRARDRARIAGGEGRVEGGVQVRLLGVAAHQIVRQQGEIGGALLARERAHEPVQAHLRGDGEIGAAQVEAGGLGPAEVAAHDAVHAAGDVGLAERGAPPELVGEVAGRGLERVVLEVALIVALAAGDAAHDADGRAQGDGEVLRRAGEGLVDVDGEGRGLDRGARRVREQADDRARGVVAVPRPHRAALVGDVVEDGADGVEAALGGAGADRGRELREAVDAQRDDRDVPDLVDDLARGRAVGGSLDHAREGHGREGLGLVRAGRLHARGARVAAEDGLEGLLDGGVVDELLPRDERARDRRRRDRARWGSARRASARGRARRWPRDRPGRRARACAAAGSRASAPRRGARRRRACRTGTGA